MIRRNDESALLYEKIKIQQQTLAKGESQFRERLGDIDLLKNKIADLFRELRIIKKQVFLLQIKRKKIQLKTKKLKNEIFIFHFLGKNCSNFER